MHIRGHDLEAEDFFADHGSRPFAQNKKRCPHNGWCRPPKPKGELQPKRRTLFLPLRDFPNHILLAENQCSIGHFVSLEPARRNQGEWHEGIGHGGCAGDGGGDGGRRAGGVSGADDTAGGAVWRWRHHGYRGAAGGQGHGGCAGAGHRDREPAGRGRGDRGAGGGNRARRRLYDLHGDGRHAGGEPADLQQAQL
ncbi:hypothetical protein D3C85_1212330 [compost metagenome]